MSSNLKPITVYAHVGGPNPLKVIIVLEELGIPYEKIVVHNPKEEWFVKINPNGRLPAIVDPNTGLTLWESGAILEYLVTTYDKGNKLNATDILDQWRIKQYLHFQMSGQGPYYGQAVWFHNFHPEDVASAKTRYEEQVVRVIGVLDGILEGKEYLVAGKLTYADIAFIPWNSIVTNPAFLSKHVYDKYDVEKKYPNYVAWHKRLLALPSAKKALGLE